MQVIGWAKTLWFGRKTLFITMLVCFLIGLVVALLTPKEYTAWTTVVPQTSGSNSKLSGVSSLAAMAGFNLNLGSGDELSPAIYPQLMSSVNFQLELMRSKFQVDGADKPVSLYTYYTEYADFGVFFRMGEFFKGLPDQLFGSKKPVRKQEAGRPVSLTAKEEKVCEYLEKQVTVSVDVKNGYVTLNAYFPDAELAAEVVEKARELLQKYITENKTQKTAQQLDFIEERFAEKKAEFYKAQRNLAYFHDNNKYLAEAGASVGEERLKSEYTIAMSVYNELAKQLEQAKIQVKEDTPAFSVIQPAKVPNKPIKPKKVMILTVWLFLGFTLGIGLVIGKHFLKDMKANWI